MGTITTFVGRPAMRLVRQLALSVTGTVAATIIIAVAQSGFAVRTPSAPPPEMTSGGKFAARIESAQSSDDLQSVVASRAFLAFPVAHDALPVPALQPAQAAPSPFIEASDSTRTSKHVVRIESRHRIAHDIIPPRRPELMTAGNVGVGRVATEDGPSTFTSFGNDIEATTKNAFRHAASLGGSMLDPNTWAGLLP